MRSGGISSRPVTKTLAAHFPCPKSRSEPKVIRRTPCPRCARVFAFDTTVAPAQRACPKRGRRADLVVAYYPTCPHCQEKAEFTEPVAPRAPAYSLPPRL